VRRGNTSTVRAGKRPGANQLESFFPWCLPSPNLGGIPPTNNLCCLLYSEAPHAISRSGSGRAAISPTIETMWALAFGHGKYATRTAGTSRPVTAADTAFSQACKSPPSDTSRSTPQPGASTRRPPSSTGLRACRTTLPSSPTGRSRRAVATTGHRRPCLAKPRLEARNGAFSQRS
jgi:hypothetical protein